MGARPLPAFPDDQVTPIRKPAGLKKPPEKASTARLKCAPRTRDEIDLAFRGGSSYEKDNGWAPLYRVLVSDSIRLRDGGLFTDLRDYIMSQAGRSRKAGEAFKPGDVEVSIADAAVFLMTTERSINRELDYMVRRELAIVTRLTEGKRSIGKILVRLVFAPEKIGSKQYPGWSEVAKVPYAEWRKLNPDDVEESAGEENPEETAEGQPVKAGTVKLTRQPLTVRRGHKSRSIPVNCGVKSFRLDWEAKTLDVSFSAVVSSGELVVTGKLPDEKGAQNERRTADAKPAESVTSEDSRGHGRPRLPASEGIPIPANRASHPRAKELSHLFDPLTYRHCEKALSSQPSYLQKACEAIADTPNEVLVKAAVARGARRLEPHHVPALCKQIHSDWQKAAHLEGPMKLPTREEIAAMIEREKAELAAKRREARRKA